MKPADYNSSNSSSCVLLWNTYLNAAGALRFLMLFLYFSPSINSLNWLCWTHSSPLNLLYNQQTTSRYQTMIIECTVNLVFSQTSIRLIMRIGLIIVSNITPKTNHLSDSRWSLTMLEWVVFGCWRHLQELQTEHNRALIGLIIGGCD